MDERIATNDPVEIIDSEFPYFGKAGRIISIEDVHGTMLNTGASIVQYHVQVKLDDTGEIVWVRGHQLKKVK